MGAFYNAGIASGNTNTAAAIVSSNFAAGGGLSVRDRAMTVTGQGNVATAEGADGKPGNGTGADGQSGGDESNDSSSDGTSAGHGTTTSTTGRGTSAYRGVPQTGDAALDALLAVGALTAVSAGAVVLARSRMRRDNAK